MRRPPSFWLALFLAGCGGGSEESCDPITVTDDPQDCAGLSQASWRIGPFTSNSELAVEVGQSRQLFLDPFVDAECAGSVASVTWSVDDESSASIVPRDPAVSGSWVTGLQPAANAVRARIVFSDGTARTVPRAIQVVPAASPGGSLIFQGTVELEAYRGNATSDYRRFVPFTLPDAASRTDVRVDWSSPLNSVTVVLFQGECSGPAGASCSAPLRIIQGSSPTNLKPTGLTAPDLPPDIYTLRIDNLGATAETVRYEVRMTPR